MLYRLEVVRIDDTTMVLRGIERVQLADGVAGLVQEWLVSLKWTQTDGVCRLGVKIHTSSTPTWRMRACRRASMMRPDVGPSCRHLKENK